MMDTPIIHPDTLSASDMFGAATRLVPGGMHSSPALSVADNGAFQAMALVLILVYMLFLMRHGDILRSMAASTIGGIVARRVGRNHITPSARRNITLALSATGIITIAMTAVRLADRYPDSNAAIHADGIWITLGIVVAALVLSVIAEYVLLLCIGVVSDRRDICAELLQIKLLPSSTAVLVILPAAMLYIFSPAQIAQVWLCVLALQSAVSVALFLKESFSLFISQRVSILHWILYLCGVELLPVSLLLAPVLRGSAGV